MYSLCVYVHYDLCIYYVYVYVYMSVYMHLISMFSGELDLSFCPEIVCFVNRCAGDLLNDRDVATAGLAEQGAQLSVSTIAYLVTSVMSPLLDWLSKGLGLHNASRTEAARPLSYMAAAHRIVSLVSVIYKYFVV